MVTELLKNGKILLSMKNEIVTMDLEEILIIQSESRMIKITFKEGEYTYYGTLSHIAEKLERVFILCNRSTLINMEYIRSVNSSFVVMKDGYKFKIGKGKYPEVRLRYYEYVMGI